MVEQTDTGWLTVLEKNGLRPVVEILENYGIDCETDLFVFDQDDFSKLPSRGLKPLHVKKLELLPSNRHGFRDHLKCHLL